MRQKIRLTESELVKVVKKIITESTYKNYGCNLLKEGNAKRFCKSIEGELRGNKKYLDTSINALKNYSSNYLSNYKEGIRSIKFDETLKFFKERDFMVKTALEKFKDCGEIINLIKDSIEKFINDYVIVDDRGEYSFLNKLNTNYSAIAYMITVSNYDIYYDKTTDVIINHFFNSSDKDGNAPFMKYLERYLIKPGDTFENILNTIKSTTEIGTNTESKAKEYLKKECPKNNLIDFTGDYSFIDMIGIDFAIEIKKDAWIPIQVKTNERDCHPLKGVKSCENWCMYKNGKKFVIVKYNPK